MKKNDASPRRAADRPVTANEKDTELSADRAAPRRAPAGEPPRLLADIGATNARFALQWPGGGVESVAVLACDDHPSIVEAMRAYLAMQTAPRPRHAAVAIANPIDGDFVKMTNRDWHFSIEETRRALDLATLLVVNDFTALAMALPLLGPDDVRQIGGGAPRENSVIGLIGPGTGLGVSGLIPADDRWITLGSEGGHVSFSPMDAREIALLQFAWGELDHVSYERLVSGPGMELTLRALAEQAGVEAPALRAPEIVERAMAAADAARLASAGNSGAAASDTALASGSTPGSPAVDPADALCLDTVECFCRMLGTVASDVAVTLGAVGGIYIGGGVVPRLGELFDRSGFRARFEHKGRFEGYLRDIPTYLITAPNPAFLGVGAILAAHLDSLADETPLLDGIRTARERLSPAEQRVADWLLDHPRVFIGEPIAEIARQADVSQPTVIRFCRSLGFQGLADFKLKLASGLTGTVPVRHSSVKLGDAAPDLSAKVLDNTISAIVRFRDLLDTQAVERAINLLQGARRIEFYGMGNSGVVALDGQHKFFRFRIPTVAYSDASLQELAASLLGAGDVVVAVSSSGKHPDILHSVDLALAAGASVIAITPSHSPLARRATETIAVDHVEDNKRYISMVGRILHLLAIDVLAVGLAVRQMQQSPELRELFGDAGGGAFASIISHANG
ncbi:glucokinase [Derxia gummosa]|uniref:Glucokinase n=1 Tax=Derxia gummosa DSM 723 TaxID=1121388 RepID=A0A8B6XBV8_9BURK|nr:glucokinase [Derxia gummosa]